MRCPVSCIDDVILSENIKRKELLFGELNIDAVFAAVSIAR